MSRLEELIQELCPDGVEYKPFGEMATIVRGASPRPIKKTHKAKDSKWKKAIKSIFLMCKSADARAFNANERSKRMAREANARCRSQGEHVDDSSSLDPSVLVEYEDPFTSGEEEV